MEGRCIVQLGDIVKRVQAKCDDQDGTYVTDDYVLSFANDTYDWLYNALKRTNSEFDETVQVIPNVPAGVPNLDQYQGPGQPLGDMLTPRMIRWKLAGQDSVMFRRVDGPLEYVRDLIDPGIPQLDSWSWQRLSIKLSKFSAVLDIEVSGDFMFAALTGNDDEVKIARNANRAFATKIASEIGKARGNDKWKIDYAADADEAVDDINTLLVKGMQGYTNRLGRMSRGAGRGTRLTR